MEAVIWKFMTKYWRAVKFQVQQGISKIFLKTIIFFKSFSYKATFKINWRWWHALHFNFFNFWGFMYVTVYPQWILWWFTDRSATDFTFDPLSLRLYPYLKKVSPSFKIRLHVKPLELAVYLVVCKWALIFNQDLIVWILVTLIGLLVSGDRAGGFEQKFGNSYRVLFRGLFPACENKARKWSWNASVNSV